MNFQHLNKRLSHLQASANDHCKEMQGKFEKTKRSFQFYYKEKLTLLPVVEHSPVLFWGEKIATSRNESSKRYTLSVLYSTYMKHNYPQSYHHSKKSPKKQPNKSILKLIQNLPTCYKQKLIQNLIIKILKPPYLKKKKKFKSTNKLALWSTKSPHPTQKRGLKPNQAQNDTQSLKYIYNNENQNEPTK